MGVQEVQASYNVQCNGCAFVVPLELAIRAAGESMTQISALQALAIVNHRSIRSLCMLICFYGVFRFTVAMVHKQSQTESVESTSNVMYHIGTVLIRLMNSRLLGETQ